jgi:hypothetical protein
MSANVPICERRFENVLDFLPAQQLITSCRPTLRVEQPHHRLAALTQQRTQSSINVRVQQRADCAPSDAVAGCDSAACAAG